MSGRLNSPVQLLRRTWAAIAAHRISSSSASRRVHHLQESSRRPLPSTTSHRWLTLSSLQCNSAVQPKPGGINSASQNPTPSAHSESGSDYSTAKPFEAIPTPERIPLLGFSRDFAKFSPSKIGQVIQERAKRFGKLYREKMLPGLPEFLFVLDPEDVAKVFRADGRHPMRFPITEWTDVRNEHDIPLGLFLA